MTRLVQASPSLCSSSILMLPKRLGLTLQSSSCKIASDSSPLTHSVTLPSQLAEPVQIVAVPNISHSEFRSAIDSSLFKQWLKNMESESGILRDGSMTLKQVLIQGVDMFGKRIGFLKFQADVIDKETGKKVPGIVFARGPAVAVLILLDSEGKTYAVLTEQVRIPGDFLGTAIREVEEETGICLKQEHMVDLTALLDHLLDAECFLLREDVMKNSASSCTEGRWIKTDYRAAAREGLLPSLKT
ncbi:hypothetical protein M0R45_024577 [Rubus argutus]|uniref:Nudix hydrolase domain-containing protein n=1 Tax=Rubus argutus TaxID=59490 RepID=A0AAW1WT44_RUBAR